jgi:hypothetical protein
MTGTRRIRAVRPVVSMAGNGRRCGLLHWPSFGPNPSKRCALEDKIPFEYLQNKFASQLLQWKYKYGYTTDA